MRQDRARRWQLWLGVMLGVSFATDLVLIRLGGDWPASGPFLTIFGPGLIVGLLFTSGLHGGEVTASTMFLASLVTGALWSTVLVIGVRVYMAISRLHTFR